MARSLPLLLLAAAFAAGGCRAATPEAAASPTPPPAALAAQATVPGLAAATAVPNPAAADSGQPSLTQGPDGALYLSWVERLGARRHRLLFARRTAQGFADPRVVAEGEGWHVGGADVPALAVAEGALAAHWLVRTEGGGHAYDLWLSLSRDEGRTWSKPASPYTDRTPAEHGFASIVPGPGGTFDLLWLDGRATAGTGPDGARGATALRHVQIAADGRLGPEEVADSRVCDCCRTAAVRVEGALVAAYRDRSEIEVRDIALTRETDAGWSAPVVPRADGWEIKGCPVNGPALAAAGRTLALAWYTAAREQPRVQVAFSRDGGATFGKAAAVDGGHPLGRVDVALLAEDEAVVSWLEDQAGTAELRLRRVFADGRGSAPLTVARTTGAPRGMGSPRLAAAAGELLVAWTEPGEPARVRTASLRREAPQPR